MNRLRTINEWKPDRASWGVYWFARGAWSHSSRFIGGFHVMWSRLYWNGWRWTPFVRITITRDR